MYYTGKQSAISDHVMICGTIIPMDDLKNIAPYNKEMDLQIYDSLFINQGKSLLNLSSSTIPFELFHTTINFPK